MTRKVKTGWKQKAGRVVALICAPLALLADPAQPALAQTLSLTCPAAPDALCTALRDRLEAAAGTPVRIVTAPSDAGGLHIELHLTRFDRVALEGRLDWRHGDDPGVVAGPLVIFSVDDAPLTPTMYPAFAAGLVNSTPLPL